MPEIFPSAFELGAVSDTGTEREHNEDFCWTSTEADGTGVVLVADGVSSYEGGEVASRTAVEKTLEAFREQKASVKPGKRMYRAVQRGNIAVHDLAVVVPELRGMATTLTGVVIENGMATTLHVGDCRMYQLRTGQIQQLTKDHTVAARRARLGLAKKDPRNDPNRSILTRSLGRDLIAAVDQIETRIAQGDVLLVCSDGLYNVLEDAEMAAIVGDLSAAEAARALVDAANSRTTPDNVTAAVVRITGEMAPPEPAGIGAALRRLIG